MSECVCVCVCACACVCVCVEREREFKELPYKIVKVGKFTICKAGQQARPRKKLMLHLEFKGNLVVEFPLS